jgi:hypothetical protein
MTQKKNEDMEKTDTPVAAGQLWRDRLNRTKAATQGTNAANGSENAATSMRSRVKERTSVGSTRKGRKGQRPG